MVYLESPEKPVQKGKVSDNGMILLDNGKRIPEQFIEKQKEKIMFEKSNGQL